MKKGLKGLLNADNTINTKKCLALIKKNNDHYELIKSLHARGFIYPSEDFSKACGTDIHTEWNIPQEWNLNDFELLVDAVRNSVPMMQELLVPILELNPELVSLAKMEKVVNNDFKIFDILLGVASKFNYDDIKEYLEGGYGAIKHSDPVWDFRVRQLEQKYGHMQFVISYKTLKKIEHL